MIAVTVLQLVPGTGWLRSVMILIPPLHIYRQLRGAYELGRSGAIWRTGVVLVFANLTNTLFLPLLLALGLAG